MGKSVVAYRRLQATASNLMNHFQSTIARSLRVAFFGGALLPLSPIQGQEPLRLEAEFTGDQEITLEWGPVSEDRRYIIEFSENPGFEPWRPVPPVSQWPISGSQWVDVLPDGQSSG